MSSKLNLSCKASNSVKKIKQMFISLSIPILCVLLSVLLVLSMFPRNSFGEINKLTNGLFGPDFANAQEVDESEAALQAELEAMQQAKKESNEKRKLEDPYNGQEAPVTTDKSYDDSCDVPKLTEDNQSDENSDTPNSANLLGEESNGTIAVVHYCEGETWKDKTITSASDFVSACSTYSVMIADVAADFTIKTGLNIPSNADVTINLHGHYLQRDADPSFWRSGYYESDGEVVKMNSNSKLTVVGSANEIEKSTAHTVKGFTSYNDTRKDYTVYGGVLWGGSSTNGSGGVHFGGANATLNMTDTTLFGCHAEQVGGLDGYGGAMYFGSTYCTVNMVRSTIGRCTAYNNGGAIYVSSSAAHTSINMEDSTIETSYTDDYGSAIYVDADAFSVKGNSNREDLVNGSFIKDNYSNELGGGVYVNNDSSNIYGVNFVNNKADDAGGGLYLNADSVFVDNCNFTKNTCNGSSTLRDGDGSAICLHDSATISNCYITQNTCANDGSGAVYVHNDDDLNLSGCVVIDGNTKNDGTKSDLSLNANSGTASFINPSLTSESFIGISRTTFLVDRYNIITCYANMYNTDLFVSRNTGKKVANGPTTGDYKCRMCFEEGTESSKTRQTYDLQKIAEQPEKSLDTYNDYPVVRCRNQYTTMSDGFDRLSSYFYYSDGYFTDDPSKYNDHLSTCSMAMSMGNSYGPDDINGATTGELEYSRLYTGAVQTMADIGCYSNTIYVNDEYMKKPTNESIGVCIANKDIEIKSENSDFDDDDNSFTLVPVSVRGYCYEKEWASNMVVGSSGEHEGFSNAATKVMQCVDTYIQQYGLNDLVNNGKVKFWVQGYSRAGAVSNIVGKRLTDKYGQKGNQTFAYSFEPPRGGVESECLNADYTYNGEYKNLHFIVNETDPVTYFPTYNMGGFIHYGVGHYLIGTEATEQMNVANDEKYDNTAYEVNWESTSGDYYELKQQMQKQLRAISPQLDFSDFFWSHTLNLKQGVIGIVFGLNNLYSLSGNLKDQKQFTNSLIEELFKVIAPTRDSYISKHTINGKEYLSLQDSLFKCMSIIMGKTSYQLADLMNNIANGPLSASFWTQLKAISAAYSDVCGDWKKITEAEREQDVNDFINLLFTDCEGVNLNNLLTDTEKSEFKEALPTIIDKLCYFISDDYNRTSTWGMSDSDRFPYLGTGLACLTQIAFGHYPEITYSWLRAQDSFVETDTSNNVKLEPHVYDTSSITVNKPYAVNNGKEYGSTSSSTTTIDVYADNKLDLMYKYGKETDAQDALLFYNYAKTTNPDDVADPTDTRNAKRYQQAITVPRNSESVNAVETWILKTVAYRDTVNGEVQTFTIKVHDPHELKVVAGAESQSWSLYKDESAILTTTQYYNYERFSEWKITDTVGSDVTSTYLDDSQKKSINTFFQMPNESLTATAIYQSVPITIDIKNSGGKAVTPATGNDLQLSSVPEYIVGTDESVTPGVSVPITWHKDSKTGEIVTGMAQSNSTYVLEAKIPVSEVDKLVYDLNNTKVAVDGKLIDSANVEMSYPTGGTEEYLNVYVKLTTADDDYYVSTINLAELILENSATKEDIVSKLPDTVSIETKTGVKIGIPCTWNDFTYTKQSAEQSFEIETATIDYSGPFDPAETPTRTKCNPAKIKVTIESAGKATRPTSDKDPSTYRVGTFGDPMANPLEIMLTSAQGLTIRYTTDGTQPTAASAAFDPANPIKLTCEDNKEKTVTLKAYCQGGTKSGITYGDSSIVTWDYKIYNPKDCVATINTFSHEDDWASDPSTWKHNILAPRTINFEATDTVNVVADTIDNYQFCTWAERPAGTLIADANKFLSSLTFSGNQTKDSFTLYQRYYPKLSSIDIVVTSPDAGQTLPNICSIILNKGPNEIELTKDDYQMTWVATENLALNSLNADTETARFNQQLILNILISSYFTSHKFVVSGNIPITITDLRGSKQIYYSSIPVTENVESGTSMQVLNSIDIVGMPDKTRKANLQSITQVLPLSEVAWGTQATDIDLPKTTAIQVEDSSVTEADVVWDYESITPKYDPTKWDEQQFTITGTVVIPDTINNSDSKGGELASTKINTVVSVNGYERAGDPKADPASGAYTENINVSLTSMTTDAKVYYTMDGTDPEVGGTSTKLFDGTPIPLVGKLGEKIDYTIKAIAVSDTCRNSNVAQFNYSITRIIIPCEKVVLSTESLEMHVNDSQYIGYTLLPVLTTDNEVTYTCSNPLICEVDSQTGEVYANAVGECDVIVQTTQGHVSATCHVNVLQRDYQVVNQSSEKWEKSSKDDFWFTSDMPWGFYEITNPSGVVLYRGKVEVDGKEITDENAFKVQNIDSSKTNNDEEYTEKTKVTLKADYLATLENGKHDITFVGYDGQAQSSLEVYTDDPGPGPKPPVPPVPPVDPPTDPTDPTNPTDNLQYVDATLTGLTFDFMLPFSVGISAFVIIAIMTGLVLLLKRVTRKN